MQVARCNVRDATQDKDVKELLTYKANPLISLASCKCKCKWLCNLFPVVSLHIAPCRLVSQVAVQNLSDCVNTTKGEGMTIKIPSTCRATLWPKLRRMISLISVENNFLHHSQKQKTPVQIPPEWNFLSENMAMLLCKLTSYALLEWFKMKNKALATNK
jgi:hypothetical protein